MSWHGAGCRVAPGAARSSGSRECLAGLQGPGAGPGPGPGQGQGRGQGQGQGQGQPAQLPLRGMHVHSHKVSSLLWCDCHATWLGALPP